MSDQRIVITRPLPGDPLKMLADAGFTNVWINPRDVRLERRELLNAVRGAHAVLATPADTLINAEFFDAAGPQLVIVSNYAVGVDNTDLDEAAKRGIIIGHTPHAVTEPTADIAWLLLLGAARRVVEGHELLRGSAGKCGGGGGPGGPCGGAWTGVAPLQLLGQRIVNKTLFIIGAGRIGCATAKRSLGWDMTVLYHSRSRKENFEQPPIHAERVTLEEGLRRADFISVHTPLTNETRHLINAARLAMMKPTAILINTSRGPVIDETALVEALRSGTIAAAGLDVYENEPALAPGLADLPNAFLLPHLGSATVDDRIWMMDIAVNNIIAALRGGRGGRGEKVPHEYPSK